MALSDMELIQRQLNSLVKELDQPNQYGDNLSDAQTYLEDLERFTNTAKVSSACELEF